MNGHPIEIRVSDDLQRSRLTVFFRLLLALPHFVWLALWSTLVLPAAIVNWFATLIGGRPPAFLHRFFGAFIRYTAHVTAFVTLAANPFPGFLGRPGTYPVDLEVVEAPQPQNRWITGFRIVLAVPALLLSSTLLGFGASFAGRNGSAYAGAAATVALLGWFVCLARARMARGFRELLAYAIGYAAQVDGYLLLLTDRYPNSDPSAHGPPAPPPAHPIGLRDYDDLHRSRLTVFFRLLLVIPHFVWSTLWGIAVFFVAIANWFATLFGGRSPDGLHRFLAAYARYVTHIYAYFFLIANPYPNFLGRAGSYPVDLEIEGRERQNRWITGFRFFLAFPAFLIASALGSVLQLAAFLNWFFVLARGRASPGLRNVGAYALRYLAQTGAYALLLTDRYPYTGPPASGPGRVEAPAEALTG